MPKDIMMKGLRRNRDAMKNYCSYHLINSAVHVFRILKKVISWAQYPVYVVLINYV